MNLVNPRVFKKRYFDEESPVGENTIRKWIDDGVLPGRRMGSRYFVDEDKFISAGNHLLEKILMEN